MRVYVCTNFTGPYPVGCAAVIVAAHAGDAKRFLLAQLASMGPNHVQSDEEARRLVLTRLDLDKPSVNILRDGNY